jgi:hypothetical protein
MLLFGTKVQRLTMLSAIHRFAVGGTAALRLSKHSQKVQIARPCHFRRRRYKVLSSFLALLVQKYKC